MQRHRQIEDPSELLKKLNPEPQDTCAEEGNVPYEMLYQELFSEHSTAVAKASSRAEREENGFRSPTLVYGEIDYLPFTKLLEDLQQKYRIFPDLGGTFVDIGCGSGRAVFAAAMAHTFELCIGIEVLYGLHEISLEVLSKWRNDIAKKLPQAKRHIRFSFLYEDATTIDWSKADLVFANSTCFGDILMRKLSRKADELKLGSVFITATNPLSSTKYEIMETTAMKETWGEATIFVHRKIQ